MASRGGRDPISCFSWPWLLGVPIDRGGSEGCVTSQPCHFQMCSRSSSAMNMCLHLNSKFWGILDISMLRVFSDHNAIKWEINNSLGIYTNTWKLNMLNSGKPAYSISTFLVSFLIPKDINTDHWSWYLYALSFITVVIWITMMETYVFWRDWSRTMRGHHTTCSHPESHDPEKCHLSQMEANQKDFSPFSEEVSVFQHTCIVITHSQCCENVLLWSQIWRKSVKQIRTLQENLHNLYPWH